jgi:hypothetical protein
VPVLVRPDRLDEAGASRTDRVESLGAPSRLPRTAITCLSMYDIVPGEGSVDVRCSTAFEFLHLLDPFHGLFQASTYMFRGAPSEEHGLLPSAHRPGARLLTPDLVAVSGPMDTLRTQCGAEFYTLERFFNIASRHGVHMPEDSYLLRNHLENYRILFQQNEAAAYEDHFWPAAEMYSLIALAQHYGVPTRALDWTYSAHIAAYFAARPALEASGEYIAVWAVDDFHRQVDRVLASVLARRERDGLG